MTAARIVTALVAAAVLSLGAAAAAHAVTRMLLDGWRAAPAPRGDPALRSLEQRLSALENRLEGRGTAKARRPAKEATT